METLSVNAELRTDINKKTTKALRREEKVPCVLYGGENTVHFAASARDFKKLLTSPKFHVVEINLDGKVHKAFLKAEQFHPVTDKLLHLDFQELVPGNKVLTKLPIRLTGLAKGVRSGGKLMVKERTVKVKAYPKDLVSEIVVDVTELELSKSVRVQDIDLPEVQFMDSPAIPIASVEITRALRSAAAAAAKDGSEDGAEGGE